LTKKASLIGGWSMRLRFIVSRDSIPYLVHPVATRWNVRQCYVTYGSYGWRSPIGLQPKNLSDLAALQWLAYCVRTCNDTDCWLYRVAQKSKPIPNDQKMV